MTPEVFSPTANRWQALLLTMLLPALVLTCIAGASGTRERVIHGFGSVPDAELPQSGLIADRDGNLYGTSAIGGSGGCANVQVTGCGTVFRLTPPVTKGAGWTETILYSFGTVSYDGINPYSGLVFDDAGNLYGTTSGGGQFAHGTVFEVSPPATKGGAWTETLLYSFDEPSNGGAFPTAGLIFDKKGNLYGTTALGGQFNNGVAYELSPSGTKGGSWTETVVYNFDSNGGGSPQSSLIFDGRGNLYGTAKWGGSGACSNGIEQVGCGTVFKLRPNSRGAWSESVLYSFTGGSDGAWPVAGVIFDAAGNLYGATSGGVPCVYGCGSLFKLEPKAGGRWKEKTLYVFQGNSDGANPVASLTRDEKGNLYGTASYGGQPYYGTVFRLSPPATKGGAWTESTLHDFAGGSDGSTPLSSLIFGIGKPGNAVLYGTTSSGGTGPCGGNGIPGCGTVFSVAP
jgi:uncharacterized repeat protein (TIGR03803 family)